MRRGGAPAEIDATALVPGDLLLLTEGDRLSADARLIVGAVEVDMSPLTGESQPVTRSADRLHAAAAPLEAEDLVFAGTLCIGGDAQAVVYGTGMHTQLGRIAALSQAVVEETSPLQRQVNQAARLITLVAVGLGIAFFGVGYRQHPQVRHLHLRPLHTRDCAVPALCDVGGQHPSAAEPAEPGLMDQPPRSRATGLLTRSMLIRAWLWLGLLEAALVLGGFFFVLLRASWSPGDPTDAGTPLHEAYLMATTMTCAGITACQVAP